MQIELTERQRSVVEYIRSQQEEYGISPSVREICFHLGLNSPGGIHKILKKLVEKGVLISEPGKKRSWLLPDGPARKSIPLLGDIAAGLPIDAIESREELLPLDPALFGCDNCFALRVKGDSMIDAHIMDGDLAVIRQQKTVSSGLIAAVMVDDILTEATLKVFKKEKGRVELHPKNSRYKPLIFEGRDRKKVRIFGKFVGLIRRGGSMSLT
ncbi:MAG: transcriptional repressor LexA [Bacteroidales bacterium]|nr:transcriptional repressor LexA [Bacteroidales bacterium]